MRDVLVAVLIFWALFFLIMIPALSGVPGGLLLGSGLCLLLIPCSVIFDWIFSRGQMTKTSDDAFRLSLAIGAIVSFFLTLKNISSEVAKTRLLSLIAWDELVYYSFVGFSVLSCVAQICKASISHSKVDYCLALAYLLLLGDICIAVFGFTDPICII